MKKMKTLLSLLLWVVFSLSITLVGSELFMRWYGGYDLLTLKLKQSGEKKIQPVAQVSQPQEDAGQIAKNYVNQLPVANGVNRDWFELAPPPLSNRAQKPDPVLLARWKSTPPVHGMEANYVWNYYYLKDSICNLKSRKRQKKIDYFFYHPNHDIFIYKPKGHSEHPAYRFLPNKTGPDGLVTNAFGFRGPPISADKPKNTIRIAFMGSSTTINSHAMPSAYPELVGYWLNVWAKKTHYPYRFEVINGARSGISSDDIREVVINEIMPLNPDYIFYYEGSNQFWPMQFIRFHRFFSSKKPSSTFQVHASEQYSALASRYYLMQRTHILNQSGSEPKKPTPKSINWPTDLDKQDPNINYKNLPVNLNHILSDWDKIRLAAGQTGAHFVPMSFVWLPYPGLKLNLPAQSSVYRYLNESMWPFSYAWIRQMADFQNAVFKKYAMVNDLDFVDVDAKMPRDPVLFSDAIHNTYPGVKLRAWVVLQQVIDIVSRGGPVTQGTRQSRVSTGDQPLVVETMRLQDIKDLCA